MVGSALLRILQEAADNELVLRDKSQLELTNQSQVRRFFAETEIDQVYLAAAKVGGIHANNAYPAQFIYDNLMIQSNVINSAFENEVPQLLLLGSSCIYPRSADQPMNEDALLSGALEPTNEPYAIAKIAGIKLIESYRRQYQVDYRAVMPTNLYGINDNFHAENSHVIPAMMHRMHLAKVSKLPEVEIWGSGKPMREFLYVDDMASACVHVMNVISQEYKSITNPRVVHINVGTGIDCSIQELAQTIAEVVGYEGELIFDPKRPDGAPRKLLNVEKLNSLGWRASVSLKQGLEKTYSWYVDHADDLRGTQC